MTPSRHPRRLLLAAAALAAAVIALVVLTRGEDPHALDAGTGYGRFTAREDHSRTLAEAQIYMFNRSDEPIVFEDARIKATGTVPRFRFLVAGPDRTDDIQGGAERRCPPSFFKPKSIRPLRGFTLLPDSTPAGKQGAVLIYCFTVPPPPARLHITETSITYRQDGKLRTLTFPNHFSLCVAPKSDCDPEAGPGDTL